VFPAFCRRWSCPQCRPWLRKRLRKRLLAGNPTALLTLTCNPTEWPDPTTAIRGLSTSVNRLFKRLRRRFPAGHIQYALVWEWTKAGWPHAHLLIRAPFIPQALVSNLWAELTGSPIVDIRAVKSRAQVANYVTKYLSKDLVDVPFLKRFRTSRLYSAPPPRGILRDMLSLTGSQLSSMPPASVLESLEARSYRIVEHWPSLWLAYPP